MLQDTLNRWTKQSPAFIKKSLDPTITESKSSSHTRMGLGLLGDRSTTSIKRKWRYTLEGNLPTGPLPPMFVRINHRPDSQSYTFLTEFSISNDFSLENQLFNYFNSLMSLVNISNSSASLTLKLIDGTGNPVEQWDIPDAFPISMNFGELDFSHNDEQTAEVTWRYSSCVWTNLLFLTNYNNIQLQ